MNARTIAVGAALAALLGCEEPYSNDDLLFVRSVPDQNMVQIDLPNDQMASERVAQYYLQAVAISQGVNQAIFGVLAIVNTIAAQPPVSRDEHTRAWGPIVTGTVAAYFLYMTRTATEGVRVPTSTATILPIKERYDFSLQVRPTGKSQAIPIVSGNFAPIEPDGTGIGSLYVDLEATHDLDPSSPNRGWYWAAYDNRSGLTLALAYVAPSDLGGSFDRWTSYHRYIQQPDGAVDFVYIQHLDLSAPNGPPVSALETAAMFARWRPDQRGRADLVYTEGDLVTPVFGHECWDEQFRRVYFDATIPELGAGEGAVEACAPELREPLFPH
jgi:hypothetical protein